LIRHKLRFTILQIATFKYHGIQIWLCKHYR
jgi:hypothetical protein